MDALNGVGWVPVFMSGPPPTNPNTKISLAVPEFYPPPLPMENNVVHLMQKNEKEDDILAQALQEAMIDLQPPESLPTQSESLQTEKQKEAAQDAEVKYVTVC
jgi:hypothetical protein